MRGMRVFESPLAMLPEPIKRHRKRKGTRAYHLRIQKKWTKRYGTEMKPCMLILNMGSVGLGYGDDLVMHPELMTLLRNLPNIKDQNP